MERALLSARTVRDERSEAPRFPRIAGPGISWSYKTIGTGMECFAEEMGVLWFLVGIADGLNVKVTCQYQEVVVVTCP